MTLTQPYVETVLGPVTAENLGHIQPHEHVYIVNTIDQLHCEEIRINNLPASMEELKMYHAAGGGTVVDANPLATGRDVAALRDASRVSGVHIIATTGYHLKKFYPKDHWIWTTPVEKLTALFADEIENGMYQDGCYSWPEIRTPAKAGLIKAMITAEGIEDPLVARWLTAAGRAARETGTSIMVHTELGQNVMGAIHLLKDEIGVPAEKILICHVDRQTKDLSVHEEVAKTGVFLEYDTTTLFGFHNANDELVLLRYMIDHGYLGQLLLSTDPTVDRLKSYGAPVGMDYILTQLIPLMKTTGFSQEEIQQICQINPVRALTKWK